MPVFSIILSCRFPQKKIAFELSRL
uniref:Uncharacterized protein n=1 Tax=Arundo donax TaxID=35708 RepID=A0A0A8ZG70_ARUDO